MKYKVKRLAQVITRKILTPDLCKPIIPISEIIYDVEEREDRLYILGLGKYIPDHINIGEIFYIGQLKFQLIYNKNQND